MIGPLLEIVRWSLLKLFQRAASVILKIVLRQLQLEIEELRARNEAQIEAEIYRRDLEEEIRLLKEEQEREKAEWIKSQEEAEKRYAQALEEKINVKSQPHLINISKGIWFCILVCDL